MVFQVEFKPSKAGKGRYYAVLFHSIGDTRADAPRCWIIRYMNNSNNYSAEKHGQGGYIIANLQWKDLLQTVIWCQKEKEGEVVGVLQVLLMVAHDCRGWWVEVIGSEVWPSWDAAVPQGKKGEQEISWSETDVWYSDFPFFFSLHLLYTTLLMFALFFCFRLRVSSYKPPWLSFWGYVVGSQAMSWHIQKGHI